jgi:hypothetical protein
MKTTKLIVSIGNKWAMDKISGGAFDSCDVDELMDFNCRMTNLKYAIKTGLIQEWEITSMFKFLALVDSVEYEMRDGNDCLFLINNERTEVNQIVVSGYEIADCIQYKNAIASTLDAL